MPCYSCKDCPGFEMHWWRKACQHCRCTKGNHGFKEVRQDREIGRISGLDEFNRKVSRFFFFFFGGVHRPMTALGTRHSRPRAHDIRQLCRRS